MTNKGMEVKFPDRSLIESTHTVLLHILQLPIEACAIIHRDHTCIIINKHTV